MRVSLIIITTIIMIMMMWFGECCLESEKLGLLEIKDEFPFESERWSNLISVWGSDSDCCSWFGVVCNSSTGHVTLLDLYNTRDTNSDSSEWYLNASVFLPFPHLNQLDISVNGIAGCIENEGFERLSTLSNLEILTISYNHFNNSILQSLGVLPSLKSLYLRDNRLNKVSGFESLSTLTNLEILDLNNNNLNDSILSLGVLPSLKSLYLGSNGLHGTFNISDLNGFPNLQELDLSGNEITEFIFSKGFESLSTLTNLEILDLSGNNLNDSSILSLGVLPSLKSLNLASTGLHGTFNISDLNGFPNLQKLDLSMNEITEFIVSKGFESLSTLTNLEILILTGNNLNDSSILSLGVLPSLKSLYLRSNGLHGTFNISDLNGFPNLQELDLSFNEITEFIFSKDLRGPSNLPMLQELDVQMNDLTGNLPWCLANFTSLRKLDLSFNQFSGEISLSPLQSLTSLQYLELSNNLFQIPISLTPLFNHSLLTFLHIDNNTIYSETEDHNLSPKFQLEDISFNGYGDIRAIPKFLYHQHNLYSVVISNLKMRGMFPYWLLENNTRLHSLHLSNNSLYGPLLLPNKPLVNLTYLSISDNYLNGSISSQFGLYFPGLESLDMSRNHFKGSIPSSMCSSTGLGVLDMSQNNICGTIPKCIGNMTELQILDLSNNNISGTIQKCIGNMTQLRVLDLSNNSISGSLPSNFSSTMRVAKLSKNRLQGSLDNAFYYCSTLILLDLSHNNFSGSVPSWIGRLSQLSYLVLGHNNLQGEIPIELCKVEQLSFLDLSHNRISGHMLSCLNFTSYLTQPRDETFDQPLELTVKGVTYSYESKILELLSGMDVSCNKLTGEIPPEIGDLRNTQVLNFSHNSLIGRIPPTFSNLKQLESLDLSYNNLQGTIPHQLTQLTSIAVFNVSYNNLSGPTPNEAQFATFEENSYKGNPFLCGWQLPKSCNDVDMPQPSAYNEVSSDSLINMEAFYWSFGVAYGMVLISLVVVLCINPHWRRVWFYYVQISIDNSYYFLIDNVPFLSSFKFPKFCRRIYRCVRD